MSEIIRPTPDEIELFFGERPIEQVASDVAAQWAYHEDRSDVHEGDARLFAVQTPSSVLRYFQFDEAVVYSHDYTMKRWRNSRGPEIAQMNPGEVVGYQFHQYVLPFTKIGRVGSAANIQFGKLSEVSRYGERIGDEDKPIGGAKLSELVGLGPKQRGYLRPLDFHGEKGFLLTSGVRPPTPEELLRIEQEILSP